MKHKLKVFLSSSQFQEEFVTEREALPVIFQKNPLRSMFELWKFESTSSPDDPEIHYSKNVASSNLMLLLLGKTIRPAVRKEFDIAYKNNIPIFAFLKKCDDRDSELTEFINQLIHKKVTVPDYNDFEDLSPMIEDSLLAYYFSNREQDVDADLKQLRESPLISRVLSENERSLRMLVGILETDAAQITKEEVIEKLVSEILLNNGKSLPDQHIFRAVEKALNIDHKDLRNDINKAIVGLSKSSKIWRNNRGEYSLTDSYKNTLTQIHNDAEDQENRMFESYYTTHSLLIPDLDALDYRDIVCNTTTQIIFENALSMAEIELRGENNPIPYNAEELNLIVVSALNTVLSSIKDIGVWQSIITDILTSNDLEVINWINRIRKSYWLLATLGLDPNCSSYKRDYLENFNLYLDSHILLRAMVKAGSESKMCDKIIVLGNELKVSMRITYEMFKEIANAISTANDAYYSAEKDVSRAMKLFKDLDRRSDIFDGYLNLYSSNSGLSWENYINKFFSPANEKKLKNYIEREMSVGVDELQDYDDEDQGNIEEIVLKLLHCRGISTILDRKADSQKTNVWLRQHTLRTNEARQIHKIYNLRKSSTLEYAQFWFVTFDTFVYDVSVNLASSDSEIYEFPCHMKPVRWLEILANSSSKPFKMNIFRETLLSRDIQRTADFIEAEVISQMLKNRVDKDIKSVETLKHMFNDLVSRPAITDAYEKLVHAEDADKRDAAEKVREQIMVSLREELIELKINMDQTVRQMGETNKIVTKLKKTLKYFKGQVTRLTKKKK